MIHSNVVKRVVSVSRCNGNLAPNAQVSIGGPGLVKTLLVARRISVASFPIYNGSPSHFRDRVGCAGPIDATLFHGRDGKRGGGVAVEGGAARWSVRRDQRTRRRSKNRP